MNSNYELYYQKILEYGQKYRELSSIKPIRSDIAIAIQSALDKITYYVKLYLQTFIKERQLTDEEKKWLNYNTPKEYTLNNFYTNRKYPEMSGHLRLCIIEIKKKEGRRIEKNKIFNPIT